MRGRMRAIQARGGKVVIVDPRRTESAREADEHVPIRPGTDAGVLLAMSALLVREGLAPLERIRAQVSGWDVVERRLRALDVDACARASGVPLETIARLARELASAPSGVAYSRVGVCNGHFGTLATYATDLLNIVVGRLGAVGGPHPLGAGGTAALIDDARFAAVAGAHLVVQDAATAKVTASVELPRAAKLRADYVVFQGASGLLLPGPDGRVVLVDPASGKITRTILPPPCPPSSRP
jgi:anaerobic selenocysteine-containing dehydrogenase